MQLGGRGGGVPESCCSLPQGEFEGFGEGRRRAVAVGRRVFKEMWPGLCHWPLACHRSKTKHRHTQRESAPCGTILDSGQKQRQEKTKDPKSKVKFESAIWSMFSFHTEKVWPRFEWTSPAFPVKAKNVRVHVQAPFPSRLNGTNPLSPWAHHYRHGKTWRDNSQTCEAATICYFHTFPCGLAVSSTLIGWRVTRRRTPLCLGALIVAAQGNTEKRKQCWTEASTAAGQRRKQRKQNFEHKNV